ncbi:unnamed protein product [Amoebophrya sp. A120]|nr:unnamed protein product [Amoebophrya sp. A120]|eukprot:GSA120T00019590001.1
MESSEEEAESSVLESAAGSGHHHHDPVVLEAAAVAGYQYQYYDPAEQLAAAGAGYNYQPQYFYDPVNHQQAAAGAGYYNNFYEYQNHTPGGAPEQISAGAGYGRNRKENHNERITNRVCCLDDSFPFGRCGCDKRKQPVPSHKCCCAPCVFLNYEGCTVLTFCAFTPFFYFCSMCYGACCYKAPLFGIDYWPTGGYYNDLVGGGGVLGAPVVVERDPSKRLLQASVRHNQDHGTSTYGTTSTIIGSPGPTPRPTGAATSMRETNMGVVSTPGVSIISRATGVGSPGQQQHLQGTTAPRPSAAQQIGNRGTMAFGAGGASTTTAPRAKGPQRLTVVNFAHGPYANELLQGNNRGLVNMKTVQPGGSSPSQQLPKAKSTTVVSFSHGPPQKLTDRELLFSSDSDREHHNYNNAYRNFGQPQLRGAGMAGVQRTQTAPQLGTTTANRKRSSEDPHQQLYPSALPLYAQGDRIQSSQLLSSFEPSMGSYLERQQPAYFSARGGNNAGMLGGNKSAGQQVGQGQHQNSTIVIDRSDTTNSSNRSRATAQLHQMLQQNSSSSNPNYPSQVQSYNNINNASGSAVVTSNKSSGHVSPIMSTGASPIIPIPGARLQDSRRHSMARQEILTGSAGKRDFRIREEGDTSETSTSSDESFVSKREAQDRQGEEKS